MTKYVLKKEGITFYKIVWNISVNFSSYKLYRYILKLISFARMAHGMAAPKSWEQYPNYNDPRAILFLLQELWKLCQTKPM